MPKKFKYDEPICVRALPGTERRIRTIIRRRKLDRSDLLRRALDVGLKKFELDAPEELMESRGVTL